MRLPWLRTLGVLALGLLAALAVVAAALLGALRAAPGEWARAVPLGPWELRLSMPALLRMATHPLVLRGLSGRTFHTRFGDLHWQASGSAPHGRAWCAPCRWPWRGGEASLVIDRLEVDGDRVSQDEWRGEFALGEAPHAVRGRFTTRLSDQGVAVSIALPDTPIADAYRVLEHAIPDARRARIEGRVRLQARWRWPQGEWQLQPQLEGFVVSGLGTEALQDAVPPCGAAPARGFGTWLPRAVVAAEDQRFYEHSGYDLHEMSAAWADGGPASRGASTLSQQLAKLVYVGDERTPLRKLRELLYAVELDRTLGKGRVLHLYLAMVPWGEGRCGAAAASRHYLHKRVDRLTPTEAAWLASLLHNPDREWSEFQRSGRVNETRVAWVIEHMRPLSRSRREDLVEALPDWAPPRSGTPHAAATSGAP